MTKGQATDLRLQATILVREAGYAVAMAAATGDRGESYSRAHTVYERACELLRSVATALGDDMAEAERFISSTFGPPKTVS